MKRIIALVFTVIILMGMFTGCTKNDKVLTLNPKQVVKSSLPLVQNFARTHIRG